MLRPDKSAADFEAQRIDFVAAGEVAAAEAEQLRTAEADAARAGVAALQKHRAKYDEVTLRRDVAAARADEAARLRDQAYADEDNEARRADYNNAADAAERSREEVRTRYPTIVTEVIAILTRQRAADLAVLAANQRLPEGLPPLLLVEPPLRHEPATPAVYGDVEVETGVTTGTSVHPYLRPGERVPHGEARVVKRLVKEGVAAFNPRPLYDVALLPGLKRDDPPYRVPESRAPMTWSD
ncbi:MAG TPA: hypothetical protein VH206_14360 [Xanthobacteraceae bacterium]|jgi:hypothetical protein|nr:hypothetical protein [Xanthobacteraceae bacterium]